MNTWVRRIRGAIGLGLTWGLTWFAAGMILLAIVGIGAADVPFPLFFGFLGFLGGVTFAGVLSVVERRRSFEEMSMPRFALWGSLGGTLLSVGLSALVGWEALALLGPLFAVAGAGCATGSLALARMAGDGRLTGGGGPGTARLSETGAPPGGETTAPGALKEPEERGGNPPVS